MNSSYGSFENWDEWNRLSEADWARLSELASVSDVDLGIPNDFRFSLLPSNGEGRHAVAPGTEHYSYAPTAHLIQQAQVCNRVWPAVSGTAVDISSVQVPYRNRPDGGTYEVVAPPTHRYYSTYTSTNEDARPGPSVPQESPPRSEPSSMHELFPELKLPRAEPLETYQSMGQRLQEQRPRFEGDLYTAPWIRGEGADRSGWCGFCSSWHRLKDSAFWYHMHYSHGISFTTGQPICNPKEMRWSRSCNFLEAQCGGCNEWIALGKGNTRARTAYFRHAYKCFVKKDGMQGRGGR